jgi:membrane protein DedA with SNARE-associated domain
MDGSSADYVTHLLLTYGYVGVGVIVALESMGVPLPGEGALVAAALYASKHNHNVAAVVIAATIGAIIGDNIGYWIGREFGYRLLLRYGPAVGLSPSKIKLGQYLFLRHGGKVVFFGRFVAVLRVLAAFLAGVNRMDWGRFLFANAAGAIVWASLVGFGAYVFGRTVLEVTGPLGIGLIVVSVALIIAGLVALRSHEAELEARAEQALPGPLRPVHRARNAAGDVRAIGSERR